MVDPTDDTQAPWTSGEHAGMLLAFMPTTPEQRAFRAWRDGSRIRTLMPSERFGNTVLYLPELPPPGHGVTLATHDAVLVVNPGPPGAVLPGPIVCIETIADVGLLCWCEHPHILTDRSEPPY